MTVQDKEHIIGNSIVFNTETSNEQIPVYAYNSSLYAKYLNGKTVITGMIALRKTTIDRILSMVKTDDAKEELERKLAEVDESIQRLNQLGLESDETRFDRTEKMYPLYYKKLMLRDQIRTQLDSWRHEDTNFDVENSIKDLVFLRRTIGSSNISFKLEFESNFSNMADQIEDVLFVKKSQDISIDKADIIEIYQFIGNPTKHLTDVPVVQGG
ncbi:MAG: hypothetical protein ACRCZ9_03425 [Fusobacteriaceae bacterium]